MINVNYGNGANQKLNQACISDSYHRRMKEIYYEKWGLSENEHPIEANSIFITYRVRSQSRPNQPMLKGFEDFYHRLLKRLMGKTRSLEYVYQRQPVGMAAVDYDVSSQGGWVPAEGIHIHSVVAIHPELRASTMVWLSVIRSHYGEAFFYKKMSETGHSIRDSIHYSLKGIMHKGGFYEGRDDLSIYLGPYAKKFESQVIQVGREPGSRKPIFKLKSS